VDLVVANSLYLTSYARQYNNNCFYIGQGCGDLFFKPVKTGAPADIQQIKPPIIGYCGFLTSARLDIKLLGDIAKARPEWSLVLVGPEDDDFKNSDLHTLKNIFFMGRKNEPELPAYVSRFNVCLNPQLINQLTIGNYPRKVDEYLAMGKPVVATATETMEAFAHCTYLCNGSEAYISAIEKALAEDDAEKQKMRRDVAESHSWENSINLFYNAVAAQHK